jgi:flagellin
MTLRRSQICPKPRSKFFSDPFLKIELPVPIGGVGHLHIPDGGYSRKPYLGEEPTMGMTVRTNIASLRAARSLGVTQANLGNTLERISSGLRINRAADDAAGLGVATSLETAVISARQGIRNANDGISIVQTTETAANEVTDILQRMRELAVQSSSETLDDQERSYIEDEYDELRDEIDRIASNTEFNGVQLADGSSTIIDVQVGIENNTSSRVGIDLGDLTTTGLGLSTSVTLANVTGAQAALDTLDTALDSINSFRSDLGAVQNRIESAINNAWSYAEALSAAEARIRDADYALETSEMTKQQIMQQAGVAALAQAKNMNQAVVSLLQ